jgi:hypothetical protein
VVFACWIVVTLMGVGTMFAVSAREVPVVRSPHAFLGSCMLMLDRLCLIACLLQVARVCADYCQDRREA